GVDGLDAGLQGRIDRLPAGHAGSGELDRPAVRGDDISLAVTRIAERVDDPANQVIADRDRQQLPGGPDIVPLGDLQVITQDDDPDRILFQVEGHTANARTGEL